MENLIKLKIEYLKEQLLFDTYKLLFSKNSNNWNQLWEIVSYTKSYRQGIEIAFTLLEKFEVYKDKFIDKELEHQLILIYSQLLNMLDKADMWEEYLKNWEIIKQKSIEMKLGDERTNSSRDFHFSRGCEEFFIEDTKNGFKLSFIYPTIHRKQLIQRKYEKTKKGNKTKAHLHEQQEDLTLKEIRERYEWLIQFFKTRSYNFDSPANKQKEQKSEAKKNIIEIKKKK